MSKKILVTCPPMLGIIQEFEPLFRDNEWLVTTPEVTQVLSVSELVRLLPEHDGWIIGDDPATRTVFEAGKSGRLRAAVKWGIGVDNVDLSACQELGIPICNTPNMFGSEVADIATGYVIALARETFQIHMGVKDGGWPKPCGVSLAGKTVALIGFGDIGKNTAMRLIASGMRVIAYDPIAANDPKRQLVERAVWPARLEEADFIVVTCALTATSKHLINQAILENVKTGVRIVNVARGPIIDESALENALISGRVYSAALDVFELEPLPLESRLRNHPRCIFGSHNASNTLDAVTRTSELAIKRLSEFLNER